MAKLYCVYCGEENKVEDLKCKKCKKKLNPKEHPFKEFLCNHIKDDLKGNIEDNIISLIIKFIKSHLYGSIITVLLIMVAVGSSIGGYQSGVKRVSQKHSLEKPGYNMIRIIYTAGCVDSGYYGTKLYYVKIGDKLETVKDQIGEFGEDWDGFVTFETYEKRVLKEEENEKLAAACYDKYTSYSDVENCVDSIEYIDPYAGEITWDSVIDKNYVFVLEGGCGSATTFEDVILGTWKTNKDIYYIFYDDNTVDVASKKDGLWEYTRYEWLYYDDAINFTEINNKKNTFDMVVDFDSDDFDEDYLSLIKTNLGYDLERTEEMPFNKKEDGTLWIKKEWPIRYYGDENDEYEITDSLNNRCTATISGFKEKIDIDDIYCVVEINDISVGKKQYEIKMMVPDGVKYELTTDKVEVKISKK